MHVMYDFETFGTDPDSKVISLGGVAFNRDGILAKKYWVFDWDKQFNRTVDADTKAWWDRQSYEAKQVFETPMNKRIQLIDFIEDNANWIEGVCLEAGEMRAKSGAWKELKPWGNGANFDICILEHIIRTVHPDGKKAIPWAFWNIWCFRTFAAMTKCKDLKAKNTMNQQIVKHNALADAQYQAECILEVWKQTDKKKGQNAGN